MIKVGDYVKIVPGSLADRRKELWNISMGTKYKVDSVYPDMQTVIIMSDNILNNGEVHRRPIHLSRGEWVKYTNWSRRVIRMVLP